MIQAATCIRGAPIVRLSGRSQHFPDPRILCRTLSGQDVAVELATWLRLMYNLSRNYAASSSRIRFGLRFPNVRRPHSENLSPFLQRILATLILLPTRSAHADVSTRFKTTIEINPSLPPQLAQAFTKGMALSVPAEIVGRFRNGKEYCTSAIVDSIFDFSKKEVTLIDRQGKNYATVPFEQFGEEIRRAIAQDPQVMAAGMQTIGQMKSHFDARTTGRTASIQGIQAEEHEYVLTVDMPAQPPPNGGTLIRMAMHIWTADASEAERVPAIGELAGYGLFSSSATSPLSSIETMLRQLPGLGDGMASLVKELQSAGTHVVLRTEVELAMPAVIEQLKQSPAGAGLNFDPDAPLMRVNNELSEISTAAVPDSLFQVPDGYQAVPLAAILTAQNQRLQAAIKGALAGGTKTSQPASGPAAPAAAVTSSGTPLDVGAVLVREGKPEYSTVARAAGLQGTVSLYVEIDSGGHPSKV